MSRPETFLIIDGHSLLYRCYHAPFADLTAPDGEPTKATYLFTQVLIKMCREKAPSYLAVAFDTNRTQLLRRGYYPAYKANRARQRSPDDVRSVQTQARRIRQICRALGLCVLSAPGYEADDVIATLVTDWVSDAVHADVVTRDKDLGALLTDPRVRLYDPHSEEYTDRDRYTTEKGCRPEHVEEMLALTGDSCDNIPPLGGFGPVTARRLLEQYGSVQSIVENVRHLTPVLATRLRRAVATKALERNLKLTTLCRHVPLGVGPDDLAFDELDMEGARDIFTSLSFRRWG